MCFVHNPTQEQLDSWYKCKGILVRYFLDKLPVIYVNGDNYYFVKTEAWKNARESMPWWMILFEKLELFQS